MQYEKLTLKKQQIDSFRPLPPALVRNLNEWFKVELTFTSNALEGNTLTRQETAVVIEKGLTVGGKTLREHLEATNHAQALDFVHTLIHKNPSQILEKEILRIHEIILSGIDDQNAGHYRNVPVRISGSTVIMPNPRKVPLLMDEFCNWLKSSPSLHPVAFAAEAHYRLVSIHPFVDGNGRTARLLMNLLLLMAGYPPAIIRKQDRLVYLNALEKAQLGDSKTDYDKIIVLAADRSLNIYLKALKGLPGTKGYTDSDKLLKIGELAKIAGETVPTIRHWTKEGLLEVLEVTESGYQLFSMNMVERCRKIQKFKAKRFTLNEIKSKMGL